MSVIFVGNLDLCQFMARAYCTGIVSTFHAINKVHEESATCRTSPNTFKVVKIITSQLLSAVSKIFILQYANSPEDVCTDKNPITCTTLGWPEGKMNTCSRLNLHLANFLLFNSV